MGVSDFYSFSNSTTVFNIISSGQEGLMICFMWLQLGCGRL